MTMGLDTAAVMFLCGAKAMGVDFSDTATIGRQWFFPAVGALEKVFSTLGVPRDAGQFLRENTYSEDFFSLLGAQQTSSVDISDFEGATHIHDMNMPLPDDLRGRFSVVHDSGTLEHVFHFNQALKNCMEMIAVGGHFTQVSNANNYMGHGFWQISPELIYRVFSPPNGFRVETVLLHEAVPGGDWYFASDPEQVRYRVQLCNARPTYILTVAKKVAEVEIFASMPQQSDYVAAWNADADAHRPPTPPSLSWLRKRIPRPIKRFLKDRLILSEMGFRQTCYRRLDEDALLRGKLTP
jgi:hypothetical protein